MIIFVFVSLIKIWILILWYMVLILSNYNTTWSLQHNSSTYVVSRIIITVIKSRRHVASLPVCEIHLSLYFVVIAINTKIISWTPQNLNVKPQKFNSFKMYNDGEYELKIVSWLLSKLSEMNDIHTKIDTLLFVKCNGNLSLSSF